MTVREARRERAVEALQATVRIPTVSRRDGVDTEVFDALLAELVPAHLVAA